MTYQSRHVKSGLLYLGATLVDSVVPFITLPFFTRVLTVGDFGVLALAQVFALVAGGLANFGMATAYNRNYFEFYEDKKKTGELFFTTIGFVAILGAILGCVTFFLQDSLSQWIIRSAHYGQLLFFALLGNILINLRLFFLTYLRNVDRPKQYVGNTVVLSILNLGLSLYFVVIAKVGVIGIIYAQVISASIILVGLLMQFLKELPLGWNTKFLVDEIKIGSPTVPMVFFSAVSTHFDKYLLGLLSTIDGVGIYSIGQKIATLNFTFMTSLQNVFSPQVYKKMFVGTEESRAEIGHYLIPFAYVVCFVGLCIVLFADEILRILVPPAFYGACDIVIILTLFYAILFFAKINGDQLIYAKKTFLTTGLLMLAAILNIMVNIFFIQKWGAPGAAWATFIARLLSACIIFKVAQSFVRISWQVKTMTLIFGTLFLAAIGLLILRQQSFAYSYQLIYKLLFVGVYLFVGKNVGLLTKSNITAVFKKSTLG
ncbi:MAG: polysaccharide biosynthesis C-terminal domain-containing protein [Candidatus Omnitrophica bacterium]|nr:polysaccharide biosynthesis C-terminal domain-containing protein [Candidatus Omnitrophota bacterium]